MARTSGPTSTRTESNTQTQDTQSNDKETNLEPEKSSNPEGDKASGTKNDSKGDKGEEASGTKNDSKGDKGEEESDTPEKKSSILRTAGTVATGAAGAAALATVAPGLVGSVLGTGQVSGADPLAQVAAAGAANNAAIQNRGQPSLFDITSGSFLKNGSPHSSNGFAMPPMGMVNGVDSYASSSVPQLPSTHDFGLGLNSQTNLKPLIGLPSGNVNGGIGVGGIGVGGIGVGGIGVGGIGVGGIGVGGIGFGSVVTAF